MNPYAVGSLFSAIVTASLGVFVYSRNTRSTLNRLFVLLCLTIAYWAFTEFETRNAESAVRAAFWMAFRCTWPISVALLCHFMVVFTEHVRRRTGVVLLVGAYLPAILFVVMEAGAPAAPRAVEWGWTNTLVQSGWHWTSEVASYAWALLLSCASLALCLRYYREAPSERTRSMTKHVLLGVSFPVVLGATTELVLPALNYPVPGLTTTSCTLMSLFVTYAIWKYQLFSLTPVTAAESIVATMSDALLLVDTSNNIRTANAAACRLLGYEEHELIGHSIDRVFPDERDGSDTTLTRMMKTGVINDVETSFLTKANRHIPISLSWSVTKDRQGQAIGITFIGRDITERLRLHESLQKANEELERRVQEQTQELTVSNKMLRQEIGERMQAEERLAAEKEYLAVTLGSIAEGMIATDGEGRVTLLNRVAENLTGWTLAESTGRRLADVYHVRDERTRERCEDPAERLLGQVEGPSDINQSAILLSRDGAERIITQSGALIRHQTGKVRGTVLVFRDITEHRRLEERLFKNRNLESLSVLAGGIAHDFNNIITGIMTSLFVARTQVPPQSETHQLLSEAEQSAFRASSLTKQLMGFAKGTTAIRQRMSLRNLVEESVGFCLSGSPVDYELAFADDLCDVAVDRGQLDQALGSVITNAVEAMDNHGTIRIRVEVRSVGPRPVLPIREGAYAVVAVTDEGPGIPEHHVHRVFDPYFTTKMDHSGLGLTTAYSILANHDGCIDVESRLGAGATFSLYLPAAPNEAAAEHGPDEETAEEESARGKVLLMEESEFTRNSLAKLVEHLGYQCEAVDSGQAAVQAFQEARASHSPFDAVVLNLTMKHGAGGRQTLEDLRKIDPEVKAIVTSGLSSDPVMAGHKEHGFKAALVKPYGASQLDEALQKVMKKE